MSRVTRSILQMATTLRARLEPAFAKDTAAIGFPAATPSAGHCAAVATIFQREHGGLLVSANVNGMSHWFNRFPAGTDWLDVDITGDQFGRSKIQIAPSNTLYEGTRIRSPSEVNGETIFRAILLANRAGIGWIESPNST